MVQGGFKEVGEGGLRSWRKGRGDCGGNKEGEGVRLAQYFVTKWRCTNPENDEIYLSNVISDGSILLDS